jgi:hypothetical protein
VLLRGAQSRRWRPGHAIWIHDVFVFRGSPAAWDESLLWVTDLDVHEADAEQRQTLRRVGDGPVVATMTIDDGATIEIAARAEHRDRLLGPFREPAPITGTRA